MQIPLRVSSGPNFAFLRVRLNEGEIQCESRNNPVCNGGLDKRGKLPIEGETLEGGAQMLTLGKGGRTIANPCESPCPDSVLMAIMNGKIYSAF